MARPQYLPMKIKTEKLEKLVKETLSKKFAQNEVELMLPILLFGEYVGIKSHGIIRLLADRFAVMKQEGGNPQIYKKSQISSFIDAQGANGILTGAMAVQEVSEIAKNNGFGIVGTKNSLGSSGCLTYYAEKMANEGLIGIILARAGASVAPFGSREKILGTNPMCFGIPRQNGVFVFDMATSATSRGAVVRASLLGEKLPEGVAINENGKPTTDPNKALKGAILNFGGYKGSGLGLIVEMLAGVWTGSDFADMGVGEGWGNLFIAMKTNLLFDDLDALKYRTEMLIQKIKDSEAIDGKEIRIPGELELARRDEVLKNGMVEVDDKLIKEIEEYLKTGKM